MRLFNQNPARAFRVRALIAACSLVSSVTQADAGLIERVIEVKPSVVPVGTYNGLENPRFGFRGTGFIVGDGNSLITNAHVLSHDMDKNPRIQFAFLVRRSNGTDSSELRFTSVVKIDKSKDLALLKFEGPALPPLALADPGDAMEGMAIGFLGFPIGGALGFSPVTHHGVIASITPIALPSASSQQLNVQAIKRLRDGSFNILQLDATAYPGNSGGPVFSVETGKVVGVINMVLVKGSKETALSHPSGISYAIPVEFVRELIQDQ